AVPGPGSTQRNVPDCPKWPKVRGELFAPVQCGLLPSRSSKPRPQSFGFWLPKPGRTPGRPGKATAVASARVSGATSVGACNSAANRVRSTQVDRPPAPAEPGSAESVM